MLALAVAVAIAIVMVTLRGAYRSMEELSNKLITHTTQRTQAELDGYFEPIAQLLRSAEGWGRSGQFDLQAPERMNELFMPIVEATPVSSLLVARADGTEYMLLERDRGWQNRLTRPNAGGISQLVSWDAAGRLQRKWSEKLDYDPRKRPWFSGALAEEPSELHFTEPYTFFTTKEPGITASVRFRPHDAELDHVVAFDVKLLDIAKFTTSLKITERAQLVVLTDDQRVIGLPSAERFRGSAAIKRSVLKTPDQLGLHVTTAQAGQWQRGARSPGPRSFEAEGETWWGGTQRFELTPERNLWILVAVPEADLIGGAIKQRNLIVAILLVLLLGILLVMLLIDRAVRRDLRHAVQRARTLGQYTLQEKLGAGGMGEVYRASHAMLRRPTAIKLLNPEKAKSAVALSRFEREVQITAELTHPNTIAVYDFGHTPEGEFYYAMEYIDGVTLEELVNRTGAMPAGRVLHVLLQACGSLQEAHERGLIHRDIKPANLMLCERGGQRDVVKVLDFGLVKAEEPASSLQLTRANALTGTPQYLAPEAATDPASVDARSDLYALGAVGYFLICGRPVFDGQSIVEIVTQHLTAEPVPPRHIDPEIDEDLEAVILACLAKNPDERPRSAADLSARLASCRAAGSWTAETAARWWAKHDAQVRTVPPEPARPATSRTITVAVQLSCLVFVSCGSAW